MPVSNRRTTKPILARSGGRADVDGSVVAERSQFEGLCWVAEQSQFTDIPRCMNPTYAAPRGEGRMDVRLPASEPESFRIQSSRQAGRVLGVGPASA